MKWLYSVSAWHGRWRSIRLSCMHGHGACERTAIQALTYDVLSSCRAVKACNRDALDRLVTEFVLACSVQ
jgi:hypothetical protein